MTMTFIWILVEIAFVAGFALTCYLYANGNYRERLDMKVEQKLDQWVSEAKREVDERGDLNIFVEIPKDAQRLVRRGNAIWLINRICIVGIFAAAGLALLSLLGL